MKNFLLLCVIFWPMSGLAAEVTVLVANSAFDTGVVQELKNQYLKTINRSVDIKIKNGGGIHILNRAKQEQIDLVITHHGPSEMIFMSQGYGMQRSLLFENDFVLLGPADDPLKIKDQKDLAKILILLKNKEVPFHTPAKLSGTYQKINQLWTAEHIVPSWAGYEITGTSARATLLSADFVEAYTMVDLGTYLVNRDKLENIGPLVRDNAALFNQYSSILVNRQKQSVHARGFLNFMLSSEGQAVVANFGKDKFGVSLYHPSAHLDIDLAAKRISRNNWLMSFLLIFLFIIIVALCFIVVVQKRLRKLEHLRRISENRFMSAVENTNDGFWDYELDDHHYYYSAQFLQLLSLPPDYKKDLLTILSHKVHPIDRPFVLHSLKRWLDDSQQEKCILEFRTGSNHEHWFQLRGSVTRDEQGTVVRLSGSLTDITELKQMDEMLNDLEYQAFHDSLTGLPNRALFFDRIQQTFKTAQREKGSFSIVIIDVNKFKDINDTFGHLAGDEVLKVTAKRLQQAIRQSDTVVRLGGDEFCILMPKSNSDELKRRLQKVLYEFEQGVDFQDHNIKIGISMGVASYPDDATSIADLLNKADQAMYIAKRNAKGYALFEESYHHVS